MDFSAKKIAIAVATILLCIVAALFWPASRRQEQKDNTIGAAVLLAPSKKDTLQTAMTPASIQPQKPAQEAPGPTIVATEDGAYTVQVSAWRSQRKANLDMGRYQEQGFDAYIQRVNIPEKGGIWYRVRLGRFSTREIAARQAEAVEDMLQAGYWIATR
ncbi:MAG: SPOR domain-containing protein [bacterium]